MMACCLIELDKRLGVCPLGIGEALRHAVAKLIMRAAGDQAKTVCGSLQLCAGIEAVIEGTTRAAAQRRQKRSATAPEVRIEEDLEEGSPAEEDNKDRRGVAAVVGGVGEVPVPPGVETAPCSLLHLSLIRW